MYVRLRTRVCAASQRAPDHLCGPRELCGGARFIRYEKKDESVFDLLKKNVFGDPDPRPTDMWGNVSTDACIPSQLRHGVFLSDHARLILALLSDGAECRGHINRYRGRLGTVETVLLLRRHN